MIEDTLVNRGQNNNDPKVKFMVEHVMKELYKQHNVC